MKLLQIYRSCDLVIGKSVVSYIQLKSESVQNEHRELSMPSGTSVKVMIDNEDNLVPSLRK